MFKIALMCSLVILISGVLEGRNKKLMKEAKQS